MLYMHIFIAGIIYYFVSALWFSPVLAGRLWMKLMNSNMDEIKNIKMSGFETFLMYFAGFLAGLAFACVQSVCLNYLFKGIGMGKYLLFLLFFSFCFLYIPALPGYLFKSYKMGITVKQALMLWVLEMKPAGIGALLQAVYLHFVF